MTRWALTCVLVGGALLGCGGAGAGSDGATSSGAKKAFDDLDHDAKMEFMASVVMPEMSTLFQRYDPEAYAQFQCATCHGEDFQSVNFKMPNALFGLAAGDPIKAGNDHDAKATKFMTDEVVPKMAELLSEDPGKPGEFCFTCHLKE